MGRTCLLNKAAIWELKLKLNANEQRHGVS